MSQRPPTIMLRSGWQTVNIGDITHTPGVLRVLEEHLPEARIIAWLTHMNRGVAEMLRERFPQVHFTSDSAEAEALFAETDFMLHGSGPAVVARQSLELWHRTTGKPFGTFGTTVERVDDSLRDLLNEAAFVFSRETATFEKLRAAGVTRSVIDFAPDGTYVFDILDEATGLAYMAANGLVERQFICVVPRLRYTPYHTIKPDNNWTAEHIAMVESTNAEHGERDHEKMRAAIIRWVRETGNKVLVCPEMTYQCDIMDTLLIDPLPADVKPFIVKRDTFWLSNEAASVYQRAHTVISAECHSPIIANAQGTPAFYIRQPTDTIKGQMYYDLGMDDWTFEVDAVTGADIADTLMRVHADYPAALALVRACQDKVASHYRSTTTVLKRALADAVAARKD